MGLGKLHMTNLKILQSNVQSIKNCKDELEDILKRENYAVACIQETWLKKDTKLKISGYNIIREDREDSYRGSCIIIKKN